MPLPSKVAILFPGQGSQFVGMLNKIIGKSSSAAALAKKADEILGYKLTELIASGPSERLSQTEFTQPAMVLASLCHWELVRERFKGQELIMAGHSIGEYSALAAAGYFSFEKIIMLAVRFSV